jgi:hypothetical protein
VIGPQAYKFFKHRHGKGSSGGSGNAGYNQYVSSGSGRHQRTWGRHAADGFLRFGSEHHVAGGPMTTTTTMVAAGDGGVSDSSVVAPGQESDTVPLQTIVFAEKGAGGYAVHRELEDMEGAWQRSGTHVGGGADDADRFGLAPRGPSAIHVRTDVQIVHTDIEAQAQTGVDNRGYFPQL